MHVGTQSNCAVGQSILLFSWGQSLFKVKFWLLETYKFFRAVYEQNIKLFSWNNSLRYQGNTTAKEMGHIFANYSTIVYSPQTPLIWQDNWLFSSWVAAADSYRNHFCWHLKGTFHLKNCFRCINDTKKCCMTQTLPTYCKNSWYKLS